MFDVRDHFVTEFSPEFRVGEKHFDCEIDLVDDSLAGTVAAGKEFEVLDSVVLPVSIDVMDRFLGKKFSPEMLGHDVPVFHNGLGSTVSRQHGHSNPDIAVPFNVAFNVAGFEAFRRFLTIIRVGACRVAEFLFVVEVTAGPAPSRIYFSTVETCKRVPIVGVFSPPDGRTGPRTVHRIASKLFSIRCQIGLHHRKRFSAFFAGKIDRGCSGSRTTVVDFVRAMARATAEFAPDFPLAGNAKGLLAMFTRFLGDHVMTPLFGDKGTVAWLAA